MAHRYPSWTLLLSVVSMSFVLACRSSGNGSGTEKTSTPDPQLGIAQCDEYLVKLRRCISEHAPAEKRKALEKNLAQTRASWTELAANPGTRPSLDQSCGFALRSAKATAQALSCEW
jgi:hypothetical protein